jgi:hypothetical protein
MKIRLTKFLVRSTLIEDVMREATPLAAISKSNFLISKVLIESVIYAESMENVESESEIELELPLKAMTIFGRFLKAKNIETSNETHSVNPKKGTETFKFATSSDSCRDILSFIHKTAT